ncbi:MAG: AbrB/MazE/SpoVT family DNA-binding domain-containing protein [Actinomycetota bacterium]
MALIVKGKISKKGWVVIPAELRKRYGIKPGSEVQIVPEKDHLRVVPVMDDPIHMTSGKYAGKTSLTTALLEERKRELEHE